MNGTYCNLCRCPNDTELVSLTTSLRRRSLEQRSAFKLLSLCFNVSRNRSYLTDDDSSQDFNFELNFDYVRQYEASLINDSNCLAGLLKHSVPWYARFR